jgi:hypothetical protein
MAYGIPYAIALDSGAVQPRFGAAPPEPRDASMASSGNETMTGCSLCIQRGA